MIAFGASITSPEAYDRFAGPGIARVHEASSAVFPYQGGASLARVYNLILEHAGARDDLEALVLVHQDAELVDPGLCDRLRGVFADPTIAAAGVVGSTGAGSMAWWEGEVRWSGCTLRHGAFGGGELSAWPTAPPARTAPAADGDVDQLYGVVLALSPWAVRTLRFDEALPPVHGHDHDLCRQALQAGRRLVTAPLGVVHHHALELVGRPEDWAAAHEQVSAKWGDVALGDHPTWRSRARQAEARSGTGHLLVASKQLRADALHRIERGERERIEHTASWRATRPLRELRLRTRRG